VCLSCSQSLINLLLTGKAVSHVWDNEKSISGLSKSVSPVITKVMESQTKFVYVTYDNCCSILIHTCY